MLNEKQWYIEAPWGRIGIVAWGHCYNPPVLLVHGNLDTVVSFRPLLQLLPENFYYIGLDLPGSGKSDPFPPGLMLNFYDMVYCLELVVRHYRWEKFILLGHSAGGVIGMVYNSCFPDKISKLIQLDPITPPITPGVFSEWYKRSYEKLFDNYDFYTNALNDERPAYTREEAIKKIMQSGANAEQAESTLDRVTEDAGSGRVRFTFDQRYKVLVIPPFSEDQLRNMTFKSNATVFMIATDESLKAGRYSAMPFMIDDTVRHNRRVVTVEGTHNVHVSHPERVAGVVGQFLMHGLEGFDAQAKL